MKRDTILFVRIQKKNLIWIVKMMKKFGYSKKNGRSEFVDNLISFCREKGNVE